MAWNTAHFYSDKAVLYFPRTSTHTTPVRVVRDRLREGKGYTVNVPLSYGMGDPDYVYVFEAFFFR
jgi:acetoin utilization deacetylase AcuC-like enzyme